MSESKTTKLAPTVRLSDGTQMPVIGLGTCLQSAGRVEDAVLDAIDAGYRLIDTALIYGTEGDVGSAVRTKIAQGLVKREDMYIITKLWNNSHRPDVVESTCRKSLANLGMDYIDLYLMHWPIAFEDGDNLMPMSDDGKVLFSDIDYVETYRAMEKLVEKGLTRSIGLSNFNSVQMQRILDNCTIKPVVNEVECHPYLNQSKLISLCLLHGIQVVAYSPFGSPGSPWSEGQDKLFEDETIIGLARNYNKTCGQIILRFLVQSKAIPIPKSVTTGRIQENFNIFDFELTDKDMATLGLLNKNKRLCTFPQISGHAEYPFVIEF